MFFTPKSPNILGEMLQNSQRLIIWETIGLWDGLKYLLQQVYSCNSLYLPVQSISGFDHRFPKIQQYVQSKTCAEEIGKDHSHDYKKPDFQTHNTQQNVSIKVPSGSVQPRCSLTFWSHWKLEIVQREASAGFDPNTIYKFWRTVSRPQGNSNQVVSCLYCVWVKRV